MNLGDTLRNLIKDHFPTATRTITYSVREAELTVKFKGSSTFPDSSRVGWLIAETMREMDAVGYTKLSNIYTSIEAGTKMTISIKTRSKTRYEERHSIDTVGDAEFENKFQEDVEEIPAIDENKEADKVQSLTLAMEYGYKQAEKGNNFEQATINFEKVLSSKK